MTIQTILLKNLRLSPINVRKTGADVGIEELAASIAARGVLQNLLVTPAGRSKSIYEAFDGGRRLRAMNMNVDAGIIDPETYEVPVKVLRADNATLSETSLAANFHQLKMTPTDECQAFLHFLGTDGDVDAVAKRFGLTRRFVEGRLRLATLAGPVFDALAAGDMTMEVAKAYAATPDQAKQLAVFEEVGKTWLATNAHEIRKRILGGSIPASHPVALLVGEPRYVEAGGRIERDLYTAAESAEWLDGDLAQRLAAELMEEAAARIAEQTGIGTVVPLLAKGSTWSDREDLTQARLEREPVSDDVQARIDAINAENEAIVARFESEEIDDDESEALNAQIDTLDAERDRLMDTAVTIDDARKPDLTRFVVIGPDGMPTLEAGYWEAPLRHESKGGGSAPYIDPKKVAAKAAGLTGVLADELAMARRDVLALHIASDLQVALNLAIFTLADKAMGKHGDAGSSLAVNRRNDPIAKNGLPDSPSGNALAGIRKNLDTDWADNPTVAARFDAFCALDDEVRASWLAVCVAGSIEASLGGSGIGRHNAFHDHLGQLLEIDVAAWWRPTAGSYFTRVRKAGMQRTLTDVGGTTLSGRYASAKSAEMAEACEKVCSGNIIAEDDVRQAGLAWLPTAMRFDAGAVTEPEGDPPSDDDADDNGDTETATGEDVENDDGATNLDAAAITNSAELLLRKYIALDQDNPDQLLFCRMGDFYEVFGGDAVDAAKILEVAVTSRIIEGNAVAMTGVPVHAAEPAIAKLTDAGFSIAIAEYLGADDADIVRVITPEPVVDKTTAVDVAKASEPADLNA